DAGSSNAPPPRSAAPSWLPPSPTHSTRGASPCRSTGTSRASSWASSSWCSSSCRCSGSQRRSSNGGRAVSDAVIVAVIAAVGLTVNGIIGLIGVRQGRDTHTLINSRVTQLLETTEKLARAEGVHEGEQSQRERAG